MTKKKPTIACSMEELEIKALQVLTKFDGRVIRCGWLGDLIFDEHIESKGHHNGSAPYARITGKIVRRLEAKGLAMVANRFGSFGWVITEKGRNQSNGRT